MSFEFEQINCRVNYVKCNDCPGGRRKKEDDKAHRNMGKLSFGFLSGAGGL